MKKILSRWVGNQRLKSVLLVLLLSGCLDPFPVPVTDQEIRLLVVDGFLNSGTQYAKVRLSRALALDSKQAFPAETAAAVRVESEDGTITLLGETTRGTYEATMSLSLDKRYRVLVSTRGGERYSSDLVTLRQSPVMEDLAWTAEEDGVSIHVDSRDPSGQTRYYQWTYNEVWEYDADKLSAMIVRKGQATFRDAKTMVNICYGNNASSRVLISTTKDQSGDFINDFPLAFIPAGSKKLSRTYKVTVQERALDEESYNYWLQLQNTNQNLGGLFDPLPTQVSGNIYNIDNPHIRALGYFSGGGVQERSLVIRFSDLPQRFLFVNRKICNVDTVEIGKVNQLAEGTPLMHQYGVPFPVGVLMTTVDCCDCRTEGGTTTKPSVNWPN